MPNVSDLSFAQVQFTYAGSRKELRDRPHRERYVHRTSVGVHAAVRKENIAYFIIFGRAPNPSARARGRARVVNSRTLLVPDSDSIAFPRERTDIIPP